MKNFYLKYKTTIYKIIICLVGILSLLFLIKHTIRGTQINTPLTKNDLVAPLSQRELNGFFIGQHEDVLPNEFGEPYRVINDTETSKVMSYLIDKSDSSFIAFYINKTRGNLIEQIQITGNKNTQMQYSFLGLRLGDSKERVLQTLGNPSHIEKGTRNSDLYFYNDRNYSVQVDKLGQLISIKIFGYEGFEKETPELSFDYFKNTLTSGDPYLIYELIMPDIEITKNLEVYRIKNRFKNEVFNKDSDLMKQLIYNNDSLSKTLSEYNGKIDENLRIVEGGYRNGVVFKFPDSKTLDEIFFVFEAGKWRAWEVVYK